FSLVTTKESFYIRELRRPSEFTTCDDGYDDEYIGGKRYLVRLSNVINLDQQRTYGFGEMVFETTELPFAESIGTTADISGYKLKYSDEIWSYGMGLLYDEDSHRYIHAGTEFRIYNAGNVTVDPFEMDLKITIDPIYSSPSFFEMTNKTTGETFRVNEGMQGKSLVIDGPNVTINSLQALRRTNKQFITLAPGWNEFELKGTGSSRVEFDFRYYYK